MNISIPYLLVAVKWAREKIMKCEGRKAKDAATARDRETIEQERTEKTEFLRGPTREER